MLGKTLYRSLLREIRGLAAKGGKDKRIFVTRRVDPNRWGQGGFIELPSQVEVLVAQLPKGISSIVEVWVREDREKLLRERLARSQSAAETFCEIDKDADKEHADLRLPLPEQCVNGFHSTHLNKLARAIFDHRRRIFSQDGASKDDGIDDAFAVLRMVSEQSRHQSRSSEASTKGLSVRVASEYMAQDSKARGTHVYCYRITLHNQGRDTFKLTGREWKILDGNGKIASTVPKNSPGVIGQTPELRPGEAFEYHSGCDIHTREGEMSGNFQMKVVHSHDGESTGQVFDAVVAPFALH